MILIAMNEQECRIVVELVSSADVRRLEACDEDLRNEVKRLERLIEGQRRTIYELIEALGDLRRKK